MPNNQNRCFKVSNSRIEVGRYTYGFEALRIKQWGEGAQLKIGSFCSIAAEVSIFLGGNHRIDWVTTFPFGRIFTEELGGEGIEGHPSTKGDVVIGNDVWIGHGSTIMSGVKIGNGAVLAANSHIVRDIPDYCIAGGNPAREIKKRFDEETISLLLQLRWWDLEVEVIKEISGSLCRKPDKSVIEKLIDHLR